MIEKEKQSPSDEAKSELATVLGYEEIEVRYRTADSFDEDELKQLGDVLLDQCGSTEKVKVRATRAKRIADYHVLLFSNDEEKLAEFLCRREQGWGALLDAESLSRVIDTGQRLNNDFWIAWFRRTTKRNEAVMPGSTDIVAKAVALAISAKTGATTNKEWALAGSSHAPQ